MAKPPTKWQEQCQLLIGGAVAIPARVTAWSYDGRWGGEVTVETQAEVSPLESAELALEFERLHPIRMISVSHRGPNQTTVHFEADGEPPFNAHGGQSREDQAEFDSDTASGSRGET